MLKPSPFRKYSSNVLQKLFLIDRARGVHWQIMFFAAAVFLLLPLLVISSSIFIERSSIWQHLLDTVLTHYIKQSLLVSAGVGLGAMLIGVIAAWLVSSLEFYGRRMMEWCLFLPLAMPSYIIAYAYSGLFAQGEPISIAYNFLFSPFGWVMPATDIRGIHGAVVILSLVLYPYVYLLARTAFNEQSSTAIEVAKTLGCSTVGCFYRITLPLARPAVITGVSLVIMETLADYGAMQYFGVDTFSTGIFRTWFGHGDITAARQLSAVLMAFVLILILLEMNGRKQMRFHQNQGHDANTNRIQVGKWKQALALGFCLLPIFAGFLLPVGQLIWWNLIAAKAVWQDDMITLIINSFLLAAGTAMLITLAALFFAYCKRLHGTLLIRGLFRGLTLGYAMPGVIIAVGIIIPMTWFDDRLASIGKSLFTFDSGLIFSGTIFTLVIAYSVRFLPISLLTVDAGLTRLKPSLEEAGMLLGLPRRHILYKIHTQLLRPPILVAFLLVFVDILKELPATLALRPFNFNTLAVRCYEFASDERLAEAAIPAILIVLVGLIPVILLTRSISKPTLSGTSAAVL